MAPDAPQPRWGCGSLLPFPRVARASQPWASSRNPFRIQLWNSRKALLSAHDGGQLAVLKFHEVEAVRGKLPAIRVGQIGQLLRGQNEDERRRVRQKILRLTRAAQRQIIRAHAAKFPHEAWLDIAEAADFGFGPDVRLNGADGFEQPTVCQCDFIFSIPKAALHDASAMSVGNGSSK